LKKLPNYETTVYKMKMLKPSVLFFVFIFAQSALATPMTNDNSTTSYTTAGVVINIAQDRRVATIHNQAIPNYMMEMTMDFPIKNTNELNGISPGDKINFTLVVGQDDEWIQNIRRVAHLAGTATNGMSMQAKASDPVLTELVPGDTMPDGVLTDEDGRQIHFSDFRGRAVVFTFFYSRCPLPNFCPLMNRNFAAARDLVASTTGAPTNYEFLSISFDPVNDTPQMLKNYAALFRSQDASHWLFATMATNSLATLAPALDLMVVHQGDSISHNLRTVVLDPQGRISRQFDGNQWTPQELADAVLAAARATP
jgi:protein SCO1